jgi:hypothetical protein
VSLSLITVEIWIVLSAALSAGGWILSYFHFFNGIGFGSVVGLVGCWAIYFCRKEGVEWRKLWRKERRQFSFEIRRALPFLFYLLAAMSLAGGLIYWPMHLDAIQYRVPRLLHWAGEQSWHWIVAPDVRMNATAPGGEFLLAPLLFLTKTERMFFLYNWVSFLWLPGLTYSVFLRLGVRPRIAWQWMWLLPTGYCYVMQASSLGNDSYGAIYALAAVDFALRARAKGELKYALLSMLSIATLTGAKQTNALLGLPWLVAFAPNWRLLFRKPVLTGMVLFFSLLASMVPISVMNIRHTGTWKGLTGMHDLVPRSPFWGVVGNCIALTAQNIQPPVCPWIGQWNSSMRKLRESEFGKHFEGFELLGNLLRTPSDQLSGLGFVICMLLVISLIAPRAAEGKHSAHRSSLQIRLLRASAWVALLAGMAKLGSTQNGRYLAPLYPLLIATVLARRGQEWLARRRWWQALCIAGTISTVLTIAASRQRPLWPAVTISRLLTEKFPHQPLFAKVKNSFSYFPKLKAAQDFLRDQIPAGEKHIGYLADLGTLEVPLWKPLWRRRVVRVTKFDSWDSLRKQGIRFVVLDPSAFVDPRYDMLAKNWIDLDHWLKEIPSDFIASMDVPLDPQLPPRTCYIVRLKLDARTQ